MCLSVYLEVACQLKKLSKDHFKKCLKNHFKNNFIDHIKEHLKKHTKKHIEEYCTKFFKYNFEKIKIKVIFQGAFQVALHTQLPGAPHEVLFLQSG